MECEKIKSKPKQADYNETNEHKFLRFVSDAIKNLSYAVPSASFDKKVISVFITEKKSVSKYIELVFLSSSAVFLSWILVGLVFLFAKYGFEGAVSIFTDPVALFSFAGVYIVKLLVTIKQIFVISDTLLIVALSAISTTRIFMFAFAGFIGFVFLAVFIYRGRRYAAVSPSPLAGEGENILRIVCFRKPFP